MRPDGRCYASTENWFWRKGRRPTSGARPLPNRRARWPLLNDPKDPAEGDFKFFLIATVVCLAFGWLFLVMVEYR